jgi:hypothetical protein
MKASLWARKKTQKKGTRNKQTTRKRKKKKRLDEISSSFRLKDSKQTTRKKKDSTGSFKYLLLLG